MRPCVSRFEWQAHKAPRFRSWRWLHHLQWSRYQRRWRRLPPNRSSPACYCYLQLHLGVLKLRVHPHLMLCRAPHRCIYLVDSVRQVPIASKLHTVAQQIGVAVPTIDASHLVAWQLLLQAVLAAG